MTTAETVRRLLMDATDEALCDSCLAFACSVSLAEMRQTTEQLLSSLSFQRRETCASCRRTVPAITYSGKCAHCSHPVRRGEDALKAGDDILHAACFKILCSKENVRSSRQLSAESRRLIENARRQMREERRLPGGQLRAQM